MHPDAISVIQTSLVKLARRANDPRGNKRINHIAGVEVERASAVMLARVEELEPARLSELADSAGVDISTASRQMARLVEDGLVLRGADPSDGRASTHRLSPSGRALQHKLTAARRRVFEETLEGFTATERDQLAALLERFVARLPDDDGSPAGR